MAKKKKSSSASRRELRRQRRIRNQILSYVTLCILILCVAVGIFFAVRFVTGWISDKRHEKELQKEMAAMAEAEQSGTEDAGAAEQESEPYTEDDLLDEMVNASIAGMPLEDRVAGLFLTTPEALTGVDLAVKAGEGTEKALAEFPIGGFVYAASNVQSAEQFTQMLTDTISKSKYQLFLIMDDEAELLTEDLSVYGINMEFADKGEGTFRTVTLPSLLGDRTEDGLVTVQVSGEEDALADACLEAWQNGAHLLYVEEGIQTAYKGMLEKIQGNAELEAQVNASLETIYRVKCCSTIDGP